MNNILDEFQFQPIWTTNYMELAGLKRWTDIGENVVCAFSQPLSIGSFSYLQIIETYIKACIGLNFGQIPPLTKELPAFEYQKLFPPLLIGCYRYDPF